MPQGFVQIERSTLEIIHELLTRPREPATDLEALFERLKESLMSAITDALATKFATLAADVDAAIADKAATAATLAKAESDLAQAQADLAAEQADVAALGDQLDALTAKVAGLMPAAAAPFADAAETVAG